MRAVFAAVAGFRILKNKYRPFDVKNHLNHSMSQNHTTYECGEENAL
ncbi:Hypothetical protein DEACI_0213 [Acididesulfobacillus acetoxydans]|uniref:Uncharacterized protein n=1 Tax=Acididesulfobacillus acetoxydans TaxID=1561005 RepID=A0ABM9R8J2_9FIRM|nr:Hypothetical protein DEACI_0213 [Acididesulfobacillus acetoxydans]